MKPERLCGSGGAADQERAQRRRWSRSRGGDEPVRDVCEFRSVGGHLHGDS